MRLRKAMALLGLGAAVVAAVGAALYAKHASSARRAAAAAALSAAIARGGPVLRVPHCHGGITLDGDTDDPAWVRPPGPAKTGNFHTETGAPGIPYTQARLVWGDEYLYLALYASDEDIESKVDRPDGPLGPDDDAIHIIFSQGDTQYAFDVSPNAMITDSIRRGGGAWDSSWNSGAHASREMDGTLNDPRNLDEEWEIELAIPLSSLGLSGEPGESIGVSFHRCDKPKDSPRVCVGWGESEAGRAGAVLVLE